MQVLDKGFLVLERAETSDLSVVNAARVSLHRHHNEWQIGGLEDDTKLVNYLLKNHHGTPFEHNFFCFRVKAPIFVFREWHRHRIGHSYNEWSARYSELKDDFYIPSYVRTQVGKPGAYSYEPVPEGLADKFRDILTRAGKASFEMYKGALETGIAKEQARLFLPVNTYSEMYWSCNARSLMHFLALRNAPSAQWEIQQYAAAAEAEFAALMPITHEAFIANGRVAP